MDNSQTPSANPAENKPVEGKQDGGVQAKPEEATLKFVNDALKRNFTSLDDAAKTLINLNSMVGDNAIAALRNQAQEGELFAKVVATYASSQGLKPEDARREILEEITGNSSSPKSMENNPPQPSVDKSANEMRAQMEELRLKIDTKELLEKYPESKSVLEEVKTLARSMGKNIVEVYEGSSLKDTAKAAAEYAKSKETPSPSVNSNQRQGIDLSQETELINNVKKFGRESDRIAMTKKYLGL